MAANPWTVIGLWGVLLLLGLWGAHRLPDAVVGGAGGVEGSASQAAGRRLREDFTHPFIDPLVVAISAPALKVDADPYLGWTRRAAEQLRRLPELRRVASYADEHDAHLRSTDGHVSMMLAGLSSSDIPTQQKAVVSVRHALDPLREELRRLDPGAKVALTGGPAADFDVNALSAVGGDHAEKRALPLTLGILAVAFGTLIAACLPFLMGLATTMISLGAAFLLAQIFPVSNLLSNVVTMVGLAIGIDYSLLMVTHYREERPRSSIADTVAATVAHAGKTITWSGLTVMVGFLGLLFSPILETRCAGIGGALVVCISVLAALTWLPAALTLLGPWLDRWPVIPRSWRRGSTTGYWTMLGQWITRHPLPVLIVSSGLVLLLAAPLLQANSGVTNERWFLPKAAESRQGADLLRSVRNDNASLSILAIVATRDGGAILAGPRLDALSGFSDRLTRDRRIASVASPVNLSSGVSLEQYRMLYADPDQALREHPQIAEFYVSRDRRAALFEITPIDGLSSRAIEGLTRDLGRIDPGAGLALTIAGAPAEHNDFSDSMFRSLPRIFTFVVVATVLLLFAAFRSYLLPVKAVITNLLAVTAGIGAVVGVFQLGWCNGLVGLERPFTAIPLEVPMMVFCLSFGLSMDYELFLLFRIQREFLKDGDNDRATVAGLAAVAPVITGAGLIMAVVFGAFVGADLPVLKMMGVGLCVSVLVDATVIRAFVVPAAMTLAGRWNWYPGAGR